MQSRAGLELFRRSRKKTLVWHWPGSSWPPSSDSENLMVIDGTSPGSVGMAIAEADKEFLVGASEVGYSSVGNVQLENSKYIP